MNAREARREMARETLQIVERGWYEAGSRRVDIAGDVAAGRAAAKLYRPDDDDALLASFEPCSGQQPLVELQRETTLGGILRLKAENTGRIGVLNFASAKNPGGGFQNGAMAQEESLAMASNLYDTQLAQPEYYEANRACTSMAYTNYAIYSPGVVFFRDDSGALLPTPVKADVLTLPAVNMGQVLAHGQSAAAASKTMQERMRLALAIFKAEKNELLVLGAYGCGVFGNNPNEIADVWATLLSAYGSYFKHVTMSIRDGLRDHACWDAFAQVFAKTSA
jgi:uncharacterized protein (TIGR02452 family)